MKKDKKYAVIALAMLILIAAVFAVIVAILSKDDDKISDQNMAGKTGGLTAMYVAFGTDNYIFIDIENNTPFTVHFPEKIYGVNGESITREQLKNGNIVEIYGDGAMAESYPAQYLRVSGIRVIDEGTEADSEKYQHIIDQIYSEPDPAEPPGLNVEYRTPEVSAAAIIPRGAYEWTYTDKEGNHQTATTDAAHVLEWKELNDITLESPTNLKLVFHQMPEKVSVLQWKSEERREAAGTEIPDGEEVRAEKIENDWYIKNAEAGYVYLVRAEWENGYVDFGFLTD